jgi:regulator of protease activity HflC (stomatin/prohibitin superfamily)
MRIVLCALLVVLAGTAGCATRSTDSTEVGVRTRKLFGAGIEQKVYEPGATFFFLPFSSDWNTFDIKLQNLEMTWNPRRGDRQGDDSVAFKTVDGNDIHVNVTVAWRIDPKAAPRILQKVGSSTEEVKEKLVRPACRTYVRDVLNELHSEENYVPAKRFEKASQARDRLQKELGPEGVIVEQVLLGEHRFNSEYEKVIAQRKIAEQNTERLKSEAMAAEEEYKRHLEVARGQVQAQVANATGEAEQIRIEADRKFYEKQRESEAILAEATAKAKGIEKDAQALAGAGGRTIVKLKIAEALQGKQIVLLPTGQSGLNLQRLDVNKLIDSVAAQEATGAGTTK